MKGRRNEMSYLKGIVLNSGGLNSCVLMADTVEELSPGYVTSLYVRYGEVNKRAEKAAQEIASYFKVKHRTIDLTPICDFTWDNAVRNQAPFKYTLYISVAAALARLAYPEYTGVVYIGNKSSESKADASTEKDKKFISSMRETLKLACKNKVRLKAPYLQMRAEGVVGRGFKLEAPYHLSYSCCKDAREACGICDKCKERERLFKYNNAIDTAKFRSVVGDKSIKFSGKGASFLDNDEQELEESGLTEDMVNMILDSGGTNEKDSE